LENELEKFWEDFYSLTKEPRRIYRGMSDISFELIPSIGRKTEKGTQSNIEGLEESLLEEFKKISLSQLDIIPDNVFEWLFLAQHYGLPTRLLDWSLNPLVALYFAIFENDDKDGNLYSTQVPISNQYDLFNYKTADYTDEHKKTPIGIFSMQPNQGNVIFIEPKYTDSRYVNQKSIFSCSRNPFEPLKLEKSQELKINKELKSLLRDRLKIMGISHSYLFPNLDGICKEIKIGKFDPIANGKATHVICKSAPLDISEYMKS